MDKNNDTPYLLSICIPTYNRAELLDQCLECLFNNPEFDQRKVEVIVSDNASTDNTRLVVEKYPLARYFRNEENIRDRNFTKALSYARGKYIRLFNDTIRFKSGILGKMLEIISTADTEQGLFFYSNTFHNKSCLRITRDKLSFLSQASYLTTWIANFGCWREDFINIPDKDRSAHTRFLQVDWTYRIVENKSRVNIYFDDMFLIEEPPKKGGYDFFEVFVNNYLSLVKSEGFALPAYKKEKYRLCRYFLIPWMINLSRNSNNYTYDVSSRRILLHRYWHEPYFYLFYLFFIIKTTRKKTRL